MYFKTASGSVYEIDEAGKRIRRIHGNKKPTSRQGEDGEWKTFFTTAMMDKSMLIVWNDGGQGTITSPIVQTSEKLDDLVVIN